MKMQIRSSPAITRVHTLHRIRTVVNHVGQLMKLNASEIDDIAVAEHLIDTQLSKPTTARFRDQIGRRARDHLETARYLGLLYRVKSDGKFKHFTTPTGTLLSSYSFEDECPKDYLEESVFTDRICRMKLANTSYMQTPRGHESFRSRICLNVLAALTIAETELSIFQIAHILGEHELDPYKHAKKLEMLTEFVTSGKFRTKNTLSDGLRKTIRRDTCPFLDWCAQLDLLRWIDEENVRITKRGKKMLNYYGRMLPVWYFDLGTSASITAAALLLINYFNLRKDLDAVKTLLGMKAKWRMFEVKVDTALRDALGAYYRDILELKVLTDFSLHYDVPPEEFREVEEVLSDLLKKLNLRGLSPLRITRSAETYAIEALQPNFKSEVIELQKTLVRKQKVKVTGITATSIYHQFKSPYEATTYTLLKALEGRDFRVQKYQAQFQEFFSGNKRWTSFSANNPDLLVSNDFLTLVECKSVAEWGDTLSLRKGVLSEITQYELFCMEMEKLGVKRHCVVLFTYEGRVETENLEELEQVFGKDFPHVVLLTQKALQKTLVSVSLRNELKEILESTKPSRHIIDV
jgi:hypothetical protein